MPRAAADVGSVSHRSTGCGSQSDASLRALSVPIACRFARPSVAIAVSFVAVLAATRGVLLAAPSRRCAPGSSAWSVPMSVITIVRLARQTPIDLLVTVAFSRDWTAGQALDVAQLAYLPPIA